MASQYAELGKQNNTQFNYVLPSGEVIPAGINPDKAATVDLKGVLQGTVASNVPQAILDLAKQQYTPTRMAVANTDLRTASGEIIKAGSEFDIMGKGSLTPVDAMSAKGAYWTETGKSGSDYVTPSPNAAPNVFNAPPASPETQKANVLTATGTTQEQLNANEAANLKYTPTPQNVNIPGNKQMTAGEIGAGLDTAKQEALAIQAKLAEMKKLDTEANAEAEKEATALSDTNVDLSDSSKLIAALTKTIGGTEAP
ncbi:MAG: hypothetical protein KKD77_23765, partial [Gammaproteobacteria bacterium]|nr:hypothetical protein [Gammaproteobacteria bacterium]